MPDTKPEPTEVRYVNRLTPEVYEAFARKCPAPQVNPGVHDGVAAAYLLGVQYVLMRLRQDLVV
jgi:hypothetical protein